MHGMKSSKRATGVGAAGRDKKEDSMNPLRTARRAAGKTQRDIAKSLKVSLTSVNLWEQGKSPRPSRIPKVAREYGIPAMEVAKFFELGVELYSRLTNPQMQATH
jgi:transcriptional regulator with XRE-family HTH domain